MKSLIIPLDVPNGTALSKLSEATNHYATDGKCHNSNPGTYNHECGRAATWRGMQSNGFVSSYCDNCKANGAEARTCIRWEQIEPSATTGQYIIIYRPARTLECETRYIGPYPTHQAAYDAACLLPAAGADGVKYVDQLDAPVTVQPPVETAAPGAENIKRFEVGKTYSCRSFGDYDCIYVFEITGRTDKTLSMNYNGRPITRRITVYEGVERVSPLGRYSMSPLLTADKVGREG